MTNFKADDIVQIWTTHGWLDCIVGKRGMQSIEMIDVYAVKNQGRWEININGSWRADRTRLHPNPDECWADYCAARLGGQCESWWSD